MVYIDALYYNDEYKGEPVEDAALLERLLLHASDDINVVTRYKITDFESQPDFIKEQVKKATAAQVEHLAGQVTGGLNVTIGKFKINDTSASNEMYAAKAISFLMPTGLLYAGL